MAPPPAPDLAEWARRLERSRATKDAAFRQSPDSPIPPETRSSFRGLAFYPPNVDLRFRLPLEPAPPGPVIQMEVSRGSARSFRRVGSFDFLLEGRTVRLWAYRSVPESAVESLFVPFRDPTSGTETYAAGRYLDVEPRDDGEFDLDFNEAYHPYCAYSAAYSCPLPPPENWLPAPVRAGERLPPGEGAPHG